MLLTLFLGSKQPPPPVTFSYRDQILTAIDGLAVNRYGTKGFSTDPLGRVSYERDGLLAKAGIDVSFYQGEIDWQAVAADGVVTGFGKRTGGRLKNRYPKGLRLRT